MQCNQCGASIDSGEERELRGQIVCEDCYIDAISPAKTCDPWAAYDAKALVRSAGTQPLSPIQSGILDILRDAGSLEPSVLLVFLNRNLTDKLTEKDLEREVSVLRNMEKIRRERSGDRMLWRLW